MKKILAIGCFLALISCNATKNDDVEQFNHPVIETPDQQLGQRVYECDSALNTRDMENFALEDTIKQLRKSFIKIDSLKDALFLANFKVEKCRYYVKICMKNSSNDKFLKGWIRRAVE